jgi:hypothetical protein
MIYLKREWMIWKITVIQVVKKINYSHWIANNRLNKKIHMNL